MIRKLISIAILLWIASFFFVPKFKRSPVESATALIGSVAEIVGVAADRVGAFVAGIGGGE